MKELVVRCSDETYEALLTYDKNEDQCLTMQNVIRVCPWLEGLLSACQLAAKRAEFVTHNKP